MYSAPIMYQCSKRLKSINSFIFLFSNGMVLPKSASVSPENIKAVCITVQFLPPFHLIIALGAKILVKYLVNNEKRANN